MIFKNFIKYYTSLTKILNSLSYLLMCKSAFSRYFISHFVHLDTFLISDFFLLSGYFSHVVCSFFFFVLSVLFIFSIHYLKLAFILH
jgi:hypothetical protein